MFLLIPKRSACVQPRINKPMDKLPDLGGAEHDPLSSSKAQKLPEERGPTWQLKILESKDRSLLFCFPQQSHWARGGNPC